MFFSFTNIWRHWLYILFLSTHPFPYYWGSIIYCTMKTSSELWWTFSITIWWILNIHKTYGLSFPPWICLTYSRICYIISGNNITSIANVSWYFQLNCFEFFLVWQHSHHHQHIYFCHLNIHICHTNWLNIDLCRIKENTDLCIVQIEPSCKTLSKSLTTHFPCECLRMCAIFPN